MILYIDTESTGLDPKVHVLLSIAAAVEDGDRYEEFSVNIIPTQEEWEQASPDALKINGFTYERLLAEGISREQAVEAFFTWLYNQGVGAGELTYVGQNPSFDVAFLKALMAPELEWLGNPLDTFVDVRDLAKEYAAKTGTRFASFSGANIAKAIGVEPEPALHVAIGGVRACRRNYLKLRQLLAELENQHA